MEPNAAAVFGAMSPAGIGAPLPAGPVPILSPDVLPLNVLGDDRFERLAQWWAQVIDGSGEARIHGPSGAKDFGIDVLARRSNGRYWAYQCKCVKIFKRAQLTKAISEFMKHSVADVERFTVFVACEGTDTDMQPALDELQQLHPHVELRVLYQGNISNTLQSHPAKVTQMFGTEWAQAFCGTTVSHQDRMPKWPLALGLVPPLADGFQVRRQAEQLLAASTVTSVLSGSGGVGKTQVAAFAAHKLWKDSTLDLRIWINAASRVAIIAGYAEAAAHIGQASSQSDEDSARSFLQWLESTPVTWLVVLDDLSDPADLNGWWPPSTSRGRVIVTTRRRDAALSAAERERIDVSLFTNREACDYIEAKLREHPYLADDVTGVVEDLGMMPLALAQATAFMIDEGLPCSEYRRRLASVSTSLDDLVPETLPDEYDMTLSKTWQLSIEAADRREPHGMASRLLTFASLLDPSGIPIEVIVSSAARTWLKDGRGQATTEQVQKAVQCLHRFSLATSDQSGTAKVLRIHALVQRAAREGAKSNVLSRAALAAANSLADIWPEIESDRAFAQHLRGNAIALAANRPRPLWTEDGPHPILIQIGSSLGEASHFQAQADYYRNLRAETLERLGAEHVCTLDIRSRYIDAQARYEKPGWAVQEFDALVEDCQRVLGADDEETLSTRNSRAEWLSGQAQVTEFEAILAACRRELGPDDPQTLYTRERLVIARGTAGDIQGACRDAEAILKDQMRINGPDHVDTLGARHNLAAWKAESGDLEGALNDFENLLTDSLPTLGPYNHNAIDIRWEIARLRGEVLGPGHAVQCFRDLLADFKKAFGDDHHYTTSVHEDLSVWETKAVQLPQSLAPLDS